MAIRLRNASLFYKSARGAGVGDLYMSLIFTAELNGQNSFEYLQALIEHESELKDAPSAWLPWTFRATLAAHPTSQPRAPPLGKRAASTTSAPQPAPA
jgi:transposase